MYPCMRAYATVQKLLWNGNHCKLILSLVHEHCALVYEHCAGCCLPPTLLLSRRNQSPDAVRSRNPSKSTLTHDAVAAAVSHKLHSIVCVGAGLMHFVYGSHSKRAHGAYPIKNSIFAIFRASFTTAQIWSLPEESLHRRLREDLVDLLHVFSGVPKISNWFSSEQSPSLNL